jgi:hypothetical protein
VAPCRRKRVELSAEYRVRAHLAICAWATCLAYGVHLNIAQLVFAKHRSLGPLEPDPGARRDRSGRGKPLRCADRMGVDKPTAFAIALTQRLCTFYLPPIWGFASLRWLSRKGYL